MKKQPEKIEVRLSKAYKSTIKNEKKLKNYLKKKE